MNLKHGEMEAPAVRSLPQRSRGSLDAAPKLWDAQERVSTLKPQRRQGSEQTGTGIRTARNGGLEAEPLEG